MRPQPPLLFVRPQLAFWVEPSWTGTSSATLQAFNEGCYQGTWCYDSAGFGWPIVRAAFARPPSFIERLLRWRRVPVRFSLGEPFPQPVSAVAAQLLAILTAHGDEYYGKPPINDLKAALTNAQTPGALIQAAARGS
jgi:hypothetical protein